MNPSMFDRDEVVRVLESQKMKAQAQQAKLLTALLRIRFDAAEEGRELVGRRAGGLAWAELVERIHDTAMEALGLNEIAAELGVDLQPAPAKPSGSVPRVLLPEG